MSNDIAIRIEGLGKCYQLGQTVDLTRTFRETLQTLPQFFARKAVGTARKLATTPGRRNTPQVSENAPNPRIEGNNFWALRDLNLEIKRGEAVGIIGRNGAGKSTLLKILSRITAPTTGRVELHGRVGALLEVGTGFHSELTGRENIYLNGSILGMSKQEISRKFDEIVDFAGVGEHLDTPVKRYSSGMRVRLGFSVAAHLEPEILIIDEVLSVGDVEFQRKCIGMMDAVSRQGRTILFVSHNLAAIQNLCPQSVLLENGRAMQSGKTKAVLGHYLTHNLLSANRIDLQVASRIDHHHGRQVSLDTLIFSSRNDSSNASYHFGEDITLIIHIRNHLKRLAEHMTLVIGVDAMDQTRIASCASSDSNVELTLGKGQTASLTCTLRELRLSPGTYFLTIALLRGNQVLDRTAQASTFTILEIPVDGLQITRELAGFMRLTPSWQLSERRSSTEGLSRNNDLRSV